MTYTQNVRRLVNHLTESLSRAERGESLLGASQLGIEGMSHEPLRHLLNNLCSLPNVRYLEVGLYKGATFCCANYGHSTQQSLGIENFSEFQDADHQNGGKSVREALLENLSNHVPVADRTRVKIVGADFRRVPPTTFDPIDVYFYDGEHTVEAHRAALTHFASAFADPFILVVDDWSCPLNGPRMGTMTAIERLGYSLRFHEEVVFDGDEESRPSLMVGVVSKSRVEIRLIDAEDGKPPRINMGRTEEPIERTIAAFDSA